jgi:hypothetical protein
VTELAGDGLVGFGVDDGYGPGGQHSAASSTASSASTISHSGALQPAKRALVLLGELRLDGEARPPGLKRSCAGAGCARRRRP